MSTTVYVPVKSKADQLVNKFEKIFHEDPQRFKALPGITPNWNAEKLIMLYQFNADPLATQQELAETIGIHRSNVGRKQGQMNWALFEQTLEQLLGMTKQQAIVFEAETKQGDFVEKQITKHRNVLIKKEVFYRSLEDRIIDVVRSTKINSLPTVITLNKKTKHQSEHVGLMLSDLHVGQEFTGHETGDINEYSVNVFHQRCQNLQKAVLEIIELHSGTRNLPELHIFGLGDNVQGGNDNGEWGGAYTGHIDVTQQAFVAARAIADLIRSWSAYFEKIHFHGVVGNHGRGGARKNSDPLGANWDNVTYMLLKAMYDRDPKVNIDYSKSFWKQVNILGTEFMLVHGDYFPGGINSLLGANQRLYQLVAALPNPRPYHVLCLGHFHSYAILETTMGQIMVNGSFVGSDIHSLHHMRVGSRPTQTIFGIHPENRITWHYPLDLKKDR